MLTRLIYYSQSANIDSLKDIRQILDSSKINNQKLSITGALYFNESYFLQVLEGKRDDVSYLYTKISTDKRHQNLVLVDVSPIVCRDFESWAMLYLGEVNVSSSEILKYSPQVNFNPYNMSSENILGFTLHLKSKMHQSLSH